MPRPPRSARRSIHWWRLCDSNPPRSCNIRMDCTVRILWGILTLRDRQRLRPFRGPQEGHVGKGSTASPARHGNGCYQGPKIRSNSVMVQLNLFTSGHKTVRWGSPIYVLPKNQFRQNLINVRL